MRRIVEESLSWVSGEIAPSFHGRKDLASLRHGASRIENMVVEAGGSLRRRPGSKLLRHDPGEVRIIPMSVERRKVLSFDSQHDSRSVGERYFRALRYLRFTPELARRYALSSGEDTLNISRVLHISAPVPASPSCKVRVVSALSHYEVARLSNYSYPDSQLSVDWHGYELSSLQYAWLNDGLLVIVSPHSAPRVFRSVESSRNSAGLETAPGFEVKKLLWAGGHTDIIPLLYTRGEGTAPVAPLLKPQGMRIRLSPLAGKGYRAEFDHTEGYENWVSLIDGHYIRVQGSPFYIDGFTNTKGRGGLARSAIVAHADLAIVSGSLGEASPAPEVGKWLDEWSVHAFGPGMGWPGSVAFHEGRLVLGGGSRLWFSRAGEPFNFDTGYDSGEEEALASSAIDLSLPRDETICGLMSATELEVYTDSGEWAVVGEPVTPTTSRLRRVGDTGSRLYPHSVQPVRAEGMTVFVDREGSPAALRWVGAEQQHRSQSLVGLAPHLAGDFVRMSWQRGSRRLVGLRADGMIACATWIPEEDILAWTRWTLDFDGRSSSSQFAEGELTYTEADSRWKERFSSAIFSDLAGDGDALFGVSTLRPIHSVRAFKSTFAENLSGSPGSFANKSTLLFSSGIETDFTKASTPSSSYGRRRYPWQPFWLSVTGADYHYPMVFYLPPGMPTAMLDAVEDQFLFSEEARVRARGSRILPVGRYIWETPPRKYSGVLLSGVRADLGGFVWSGSVVLARLEPLRVALRSEVGVGVATGLRIRPVELVLRFRRARHRVGEEYAFGFSTSLGDLGLVEFGGRLVSPRIFSGVVGEGDEELDAGLYSGRLSELESTYRSTGGVDLPAELGSLKLDEFLLGVDGFCEDSGDGVSDLCVVEEVRVRGFGWQSASLGLWSWMQPFVHSAELISVTMEARIGDL
ncbi:MAG: hypothetical protein OD811_05805 [Alphaproteobacteria bacterium]